MRDDPADHLYCDFPSVTDACTVCYDIHMYTDNPDT